MKSVWVGLERLSFVAVIVVAALVIWKQLHLPENSSPARTELVVPKEPVSLANTHTTGSSAAPVGLVIFSDFQCPFCGKFAQETWPRIEKEFVAGGHVFVGFWNVPLKSLHPTAVHAATVAECAGRQGKFWQVHDLFFGVRNVAPALTKDATREFIETRIASLELDHSALKDCISSDASQKVQRDVSGAAALGVQSTPNFLVGRLEADHTLRATKWIRGAKPVEEFRTALSEALKSR